MKLKTMDLKETLKEVRKLEQIKEGYIDLVYWAPVGVGGVATFRAGRDERGFYSYTFRGGYWQGQRLYYDDIEELLKAVKANEARAVNRLYEIIAK